MVRVLDRLLTVDDQERTCQMPVTEFMRHDLTEIQHILHDCFDCLSTSDHQISLIFF